MTAPDRGSATGGPASAGCRTMAGALPPPLPEQRKSPAIALWCARCARAGTAVEIRTINRRRATNRAGAAEYLNRSLQTINLLASPKRRAATGWPDPIAVSDRQSWYALADLDRFRVRYIQPTERSQRAKVHTLRLDGDPDELITAAQFRQLIGATRGTWSRYVYDSRPAWEQGRDEYLPRPDREEPIATGTRRQWRKQRVVEWINARPGKAPSPGRPPARRRETAASPTT